MIVSNNPPRVSSYNTTVLQKVIIPLLAPHFGAAASPKGCSTYGGRFCMWVHSQPPRLQAESLIIVPFLLPQAPHPHPRPTLPPPRSSSSSRWLSCLLALLLPLGLVVMSKAVRQSVTTHTHTKKWRKIHLRISHAAFPSCLSHYWLSSSTQIHY